MSKFSIILRKIFRPTPDRFKDGKNYEEIFAMTLRQWFLYHQKHVAFNRCRWMGVKAIKNPLDAWIYQEIIHEVKPDVIVEIGSAEGGSTLFLANLLDILKKGIVISVDWNREHYNVKHPRIHEITADSSLPETVKKIAEMCKSKSVMIIHDGGHTKDQVLKDLKAYSDLVSLGSYFIVEDGIIDLFNPGDGIGTFNQGPLAAIEEFLAKNANFAIDQEREHYILTYNPKGFLKRIK